MSKEEMNSIVEGILFMLGETCELDKIAYALDLDIKTTKYLMDEFIKDYNDANRGMKIIEVDESYQMVSNPQIFEYLIKVAKKPKKYQLTQATLETLAIVAYKQPVTKLDIEKIRGVKSDYMISKLIEYDLVEELGRAETIGRPIMFGTTKKFLRLFGIKNIDELKNMSQMNIDFTIDDGKVLNE